MADETQPDGDGQEPVLSAAAATAAMRSLMKRLNEAVPQAEDAARKANSEAAFAFNAKETCEAHATAIAQIKGVAEAESAWLTTTRKTVEESTQVVSGFRKEAEDAAKACAVAKADSESFANVALGLRDKANDVVRATDAASMEVMGAKQRAIDASTEIARLKVVVEGDAAQVDEDSGKVEAFASQVKAESATTSESKNKAIELLGVMSETTQTANGSHRRVMDYETELRSLKASFKEMQEKIEALLPGATSAGLASAFQDQKARFELVKWLWMSVFIATVAALAFVGWRHLQEVNQVVMSTTEHVTWDFVLRQLTNRLLLVVPLVWLGLVAGRSYSTAVRVQEDYAYKEAMSRSFEGYKREMGNLPTAAELIPLLRLCEGVLVTLSERPGRLYEGKHDDVTPFSVAAKASTDVLAQLKDLVPKLNSILPKQPPKP